MCENEINIPKRVNRSSGVAFYLLEWKEHKEQPVANHIIRYKTDIGELSNRNVQNITEQVK